MTLPTIDVLRHGDTGFTGFRGTLDDPLTPLGWQQMEQAVAEKRWDMVISSPSQRCAQFAQRYSARQGVPLEIEKRLVEYDFGMWEGKTAAELMQTDAAALQSFWQDPEHFSPPNEVELARSLLCYPLVGLLIGSLLASANWMFAGHLPPMLLAALLLLFWVMLTGGLHLDGLADCADGWLGGHGDRERTLKIMHDPQSGSAAIVVVTLVLLVKFAALTALMDGRHLLGVMFVPILARTMLPLLFLTTPCARTEGLAASLAARLPRKAAWFVVLLGLLVTLLALPYGVWLVSVGLLTFVLLRRMMLTHIGGMNGDTAGALVELSETVALVVLACV